MAGVFRTRCTGACRTAIRVFTGVAIRTEWPYSEFMDPRPTIYIECDIPPGMTCEEYRRLRAATRYRQVRRPRFRFPRRRPR